MESIAKPSKIEFVPGANPNEVTVNIEPFYPGYGMTVGNSLRRVMLSSLVGTAVVGVKIEGASHEFTTLPHVKEDILEIILNLKKLKGKILIDAEEEVKLELEIHGKKEVTAGDIKKDSRVQIVNKDLVIANITDMAGSLKMEIILDRGRGYRPVEAIEKKRGEIGYIDMDAIFSPVLAVGLNVENVRVGKMTNWDKLILNIVTDGTITPKEAYGQTVAILQEQVGALTAEEKVEEVAAEEIASLDQIEEEAEDEDVEEDADDDKKAKKEKKEKKEKKAKKTK